MCHFLVDPRTSDPPSTRKSQKHIFLISGGGIVGILIVAGLVLTLGYFRIATLPASGRSLLGPEIVFSSPRLRVGTFNVDGGVGVDGRFDLPRVAAEMKDCDLVGLQEIHGRTLFQQADQCAILGQALHEDWLFAASERQWWHESFGNGVLCRLPCTHWDRLPIAGKDASNHRSILRLDVSFQSRIIHVLIAHMPTTNDRDSQGEIIRSLFLDVAPPALLLGDLNSKPGERWIESLRHEPGVVDGVGMFSETKQPTHVDWILARGLNCVGGDAADHGASDHPLYWNDFTLPNDSTR